MGAATVLGVSNGPPFVYGFATPFASAPEVTVATTAGMRGFNGGWTQTHGNPSASPTQLFLSVDEDQLVDNERSRQAERVAYAAFATPIVYPAPGAGCTSDAECDDGDACNGTETCDAGSCLPGAPLVCDDGEYCNGLETCVAGSCQAGAAPSCDDGVECTVDSCDETADACLNVAHDALCDNGLFCDGVETCEPDVGCAGGTPACPSGICDEELDVCEVSNDPQATLESGVVTVGADRMTVGLARSYVRPVVVCTVQYANNSLPVLARVSGVTGNSFDVRLVNPSGAPVVAERVSYLVVEEGVWVIDGVRIEAQRYLSTVTDEDQNWIGEARAYAHSYTAPVVVGQVMTENDPSWSVFWSYGGSRRNPPSSTRLHTGKTVCEDPNATRADETIGVIVFETTRGTIGGVAFEAAMGPQTVAGLPNGAPFAYGFSRTFATAPQVGVTSVSGMRGMNGGWAQTHGRSMSTRSQLFVSVDEDQTLDAERSRTTERLSYIVFEQPVAYPQ